MKIKEVRIIFPGRVQEFCVANNFYTKGNNTQYEHLLFTLCSAKKNLTINRLEKIATDIIAHSEENVFYEYCENSVNERLLTMMYNLVRECTETFYDSI